MKPSALGGLLPRLRHPVVVTVTDGAPRNPGDTAARRLRTAAMTTPSSGATKCSPRSTSRACSADQIRALGVVDQEASLEMAYLTLRIVDLLRELRPSVLLTHPYEGCSRYEPRNANGTEPSTIQPTSLRFTVPLRR